MPGPEEPRQRDSGGGKPDDHPDGQDPWRGSQRPHDEARDGDDQSDVPHSEGPDSHPPVSVVLQLHRLIHAQGLFHSCATNPTPFSSLDQLSRNLRARRPGHDQLGGGGTGVVVAWTGARPTPADFRRRPASARNADLESRGPSSEPVQRCIGFADWRHLNVARRNVPIRRSGRSGLIFGAVSRKATLATTSRRLPW